MAPPARRSLAKTAIQLRISLMEHTPTIWRRLLVPGEIKLSKVHPIFQAAMGWEDHHLHLFEIGDRSYGEPDDESEDEEIDEGSVLFSELVEAPMRFRYQYDFGDDWRHEVVVESIEPVPLILKFAACLDGQRACPPEDCGGSAVSSSSSPPSGTPTANCPTGWGPGVPSTPRSSAWRPPTPRSSGCADRSETPLTSPLVESGP